MMKQSVFYTLLREPLLHFLLIGAGLFLLYSQIADPLAETDQRITITQTDLERLASAWLKRTGRPPSAQEREQQIEHYIREQVLYREAMAMGLDQDDVIVRRRLAQKMEYLFNDLSFVPDPSDTELALFLSENSEKFTQPATLSFRQIYLDPSQRNEKIAADAQDLLDQLKDTSTVDDTIQLGDRSLLPYHFTNERESRIAGMFGTEFSVQVFALPLDGWQGPISSEYGLHLIYINSRTQARLPPLEEIRERVARDWRSTKQDQANEVFYQSLFQRYKIILDKDTTQAYNLKENMASSEQ